MMANVVRGWVRLGHIIKCNAPLLMAIGSGVGTLTSVASGVATGVEMKDLHDQYLYDKDHKRDYVVKGAKSIGRTVALTGGTLYLIGKTHTYNAARARKYAAIISAQALTIKELMNQVDALNEVISEYEDEMVAELKNKARENYLEKKYANAPATTMEEKEWYDACVQSGKIYTIDKDGILFHEVESGNDIWFRQNTHVVENVCATINRNLQKSGIVTLREVYLALGFDKKHIPEGADLIGWNADVEREMAYDKYGEEQCWVDLLYSDPREEALGTTSNNIDWLIEESILPNSVVVGEEFREYALKSLADTYIELSFSHTPYPLYEEPYNYPLEMRAIIANKSLHSYEAARELYERKYDPLELA